MTNVFGLNGRTWITLTGSKNRPPNLRFHAAGERGGKIWINSYGPFEQLASFNVAAPIQMPQPVAPTQEEVVCFHVDCALPGKPVFLFGRQLDLERGNDLLREIVLPASLHTAMSKNGEAHVLDSQ